MARALGLERGFLGDFVSAVHAARLEFRNVGGGGDAGAEEPLGIGCGDCGDQRDVVDRLEFGAADLGPRTRSALATPDRLDRRLVRLKATCGGNTDGFVECLVVPFENRRSACGQIGPRHDHRRLGADDPAEVARVREPEMVEELPVMGDLKQIADTIASE